MAHRGDRRLLNAALAALALASCQTATQVLVQLDTDVPVTTPLILRACVRMPSGSLDAGAGMDARATGSEPSLDAGGTSTPGTFCHTWSRGAGGSDLQLPATFGVLPAPGAPQDSRVELTLEATVGDLARALPVVLRRTVNFQFTPRAQRTVRVFLAQSCAAIVSGCERTPTGQCTLQALCEERDLVCGDEARCVPRTVQTTTGPSPDAGGCSCSPRPNSQATCGVGGACAYACVAGAADCDGNPANGCEVELATDATHCGACATSCPARANATPACSASACTARCVAGFGDCDGNPANGCETNLSDPAHCGACTTACSGATPLCALQMGGAYACSSGCSAGQLRCGSSCVDPQSNAAHCGACGRSCGGAPNAMGACEAGACRLLCNRNFADCDSNPANGCETNLLSSDSSCGACGRSCAASVPHAVGTCTTGACGLRCAPGYQDCDGSADTGCEVDLQSDRNNCGACRNPCPGGQTCMAGACASGCVPNAPCATGMPCRPMGTTTCLASSGTCTPGPAVAAGTPCGPNAVCAPGGDCTACQAGLSCTIPGNPCMQGTTSCSSGSQQCASPTPVTPGTPCGGGNVCSPAGTCEACPAGSCTPPGGLQPCQHGAYVCTTGVPTCVATADPPSTACDDGNPCTTSDQCDASGSCVGAPSQPTPGGVSQNATATSGPHGDPVNGLCFFSLYYCSTSGPQGVGAPAWGAGYAGGDGSGGSCDYNDCPSGPTSCQRNFCLDCAGDCSSCPMPP